MTKVSTKTCDQCHAMHRRCNRELPSCLRCFKLSISCTWDRPRALPKYASFEIKNRFIVDSAQIESQPSPKKQNIIIIKSSTFQATKKTKKNLRLPLAFLNIPLPISNINSITKLWKNIFDVWFQSTIRRYTFKIFLCSCDVSIESSKKQNFKLIDIVMSAKKLSILEDQESLPLQPTFENDITSLTSQAIKAYFYYFNPLFPLFTYTSFYRHPRSNFLKYVIIGIGLRFLPYSILREQLLAIVEKKISLKKLSSMTFNLDTLQALLSLFAGFVWSKVEGINYSIFSVSISIMYSIGLHHSKYQKNATVFLERSLAFYVLNYLSTLFFIEGVSFFSLQGISDSKLSICFFKYYSFEALSKISSAYQPLEYTQLEYFYLTITEQLHQSSRILYDISEVFITSQKGLLDSAIIAEKKILNLLEFGLRRLKSMELNNSHISKKNLQLPSEFSNEFYNPSLFELIHTLRVRLCFDLLRLFDLLIKTKSIELNKTKLVDLYKRIFKYSTFVIKGLAAINLDVPFTFYRPNMTLFSIRMAIQASHHCGYNSLNQLIDISLSIFQSLTKQELYSHSAIVQKKLVEEMIKNIN